MRASYEVESDHIFAADCDFDIAVVLIEVATRIRSITILLTDYAVPISVHTKECNGETVFLNKVELTTVCFEILSEL